MIVGDSITQGSAGDWTWRHRLFRHLQPRVEGLDLVGPRNDLFDNVAGVHGNQQYADPGFDRDHNAVWGNTLAASGDTIAGRTAAAAPDVMLVLLGINDLTFLSSPEGTEASLRRFIANARVGGADVKFVFGRPEAPWKTITLPRTERQRTGTYCGPAAMQAVMSFHHTWINQDDIAFQVATGSIGTLPNNMNRATERWTPDHPYEATANVTNARLLGGVMSAIDARTGPVVILVQAVLRPWAPSDPSILDLVTAHYLVITGYKDDDLDGMGPQYRVWDPARDASFASISYPMPQDGYVIAPASAL